MMVPAVAEGPPGNLEVLAEALIADVSELKGILDGPGSSQEDVLDALGRLRKHGNLPTIVLSETLIGKCVNQIAKTSTIEILRTTAMELVCSWKQSHRKRKAEALGLHIGMSPSSSIAAIGENDLADPRHSSTLSMASGEAGDVKTEGRMTPQRQKVALKLKEALSDDGGVVGKKGSAHGDSESNDPTILSSEIEAALWRDLGEKEKDYMNQVRAILFNLKDKNNPTFKSNVLAGFVPVDTMPTLTTADMASAEKMAERKQADEIDRARQKGIRDILIAMGKAKGVPPTPPPSALKGR